MYVKVELKRYRNLKSTGKVVMNVRFVAYYQLMQVCQVDNKVCKYPKHDLPWLKPEHYNNKIKSDTCKIQNLHSAKEAKAPLLYTPMQRDLKFFSDTAPMFCSIGTGDYMQGSAFTGNSSYSIPTSPNILSPNVGNHFSRLEFEPFTNCPQNLIIFDQTDVKHREDTNEIDILLSSDEGEEFDDDTISTDRTPGNWHSTSCSSSSCNSTYGGPDWDECKRERMWKLVNILQEIVPGMEGLDTGTVLDEAVKYLKYLKKEVEKLGISSLDCGVP